MRLGLVGANSDARRRANCYERLPDVTVSGVVTPNTDPDWAAARYDDVTALVESEVLDAVDVCDPNTARTQYEMVNVCLDAGVGVVCRPPIADDLDEATAIRDAAGRGDVPVLVDALHRFARENRDAKEAVDAGEIGESTTVRTTRRLPAVGSSDRNDAAAYDAFLRRALSPDVARVRWLFGDIERVYTRIGVDEPSDNGRLTHAVVIARFASGAIGHLDVRVGNRYDRVSTDFEYSGTEGRLSYGSEEFAALDVAATTSFEPGVTASLRRPRPSSDLYDRHVEHIVASLRGDTDTVEAVDETVETLRTVVAAVRSSRRGVPVTVAEVTV
ncbi:Gfo/Idh/MocA family protein [Halomontanus rarus]|uniref:Gfo/Idh/MocA family protein n=1 Tax=Halomontanus rarus TaxID=3034020 RepID=UPI0023E75910|nr:Gfo/Idh/MocA family oxidoreductase [Halovivax sp. TS33]